MKTPTAYLLLLLAFLLCTSSVFSQAVLSQETVAGGATLLGSAKLYPQDASLSLSIPSINKSAFQNTFSSNSSASLPPILNFEGIDVVEATGAVVPNPNGDISPQHYIQVTNSGAGSIFKIHDKAGDLLFGPASLNNLWGPFGRTGGGKPIILWDQEAERWLFTEIAAGIEPILLTAVSQTDDPFGNWYVYEFETPNYPDYPKYGIWPDAYYITTREGSAEPNIPVYALDREAMLNGDPVASVQRLGIPKYAIPLNEAFQAATPVDWDGAISPPGAYSPHLVLRMYDNAWDGGQDKLEIWEITIDWVDPNNSTVVGPIELFTEPFDSDVCSGTFLNCLPQENGSNISAYIQVLMHRVNYRNFGTYESIVLTHVVDVDGDDLAGLKWYELRKPNNGQWTIYQEGTVSTDDNHRFMASIAIDASGNIGIGYSMMGEEKHLSLAYTGRLKDDPLGEMTIEEYEFASGMSLFNGFQWGNHAMMSVDETDGHTFWFTGEYMKADNLWGSKVVSFEIQKDSIDVGPIKIDNPINSAYLTDSEMVHVQVKNFGLKPQTNFAVGLIIDNNFIAEQTVIDTLNPDSTMMLSFESFADLSVVGDYEFKIYTDLANDSDILNDTLRTIISKLTRYDAAVTEIIDVENLICDTTGEARIVITNIGAEVLETVDVEWQCNAAPLQSMGWFGALEIGESDTITVTLSGLIDGNNNITAQTANPNEEVDEDMTNDQLDRIFEVNTMGEIISFNLTTDDFPYETTWTLEDEFGMIVYEGGPYFSTMSNFDEAWCLEEGCYTFKIYDEQGDGMSSQNSGFYEITNSEGKIFAHLTEPDFGSIETKTFCTPFVCTLESTISTGLESEFAAFDGSININASFGLPPLQYSIDGGNNFFPSPLFTGLTGNIYPVIVEDLNGCQVEQEVIVETCTVQFSYIATNASDGIENGSIEITAVNGVPPYEYSIDNGMTYQDSSDFEELPGEIYTVIIRDSLGCTYSTDVDVSYINGLAENEGRYLIELSPNPTDDILTIAISGFDKSYLDFDLLTVTGQVLKSNRLIHNGNTLQGQLSMNALPKGLYFIRFKHEAFLPLSKVIKR